MLSVCSHVRAHVSSTYVSVNIRKYKFYVRHNWTRTKRIWLLVRPESDKKPKHRKKRRWIPWVSACRSRCYCDCRCFFSSVFCFSCFRGFFLRLFGLAPSMNVHLNKPCSKCGASKCFEHVTQTTVVRLFIVINNNFTLHYYCHYYNDSVSTPFRWTFFLLCFRSTQICSSLLPLKCMWFMATALFAE